MMHRSAEIRRAVVVFSIATLAAGAFPQARAASIASDAIDYPELAVVPRATERLEREASQEPEHRWSTHLPEEASAILTLAGGLAQSVTDPSKDSRSNLAGVAVGGGWLALSVALSLAYTPYEDSWREVNAMPKRTPREQLARERAAEEALHAPARLGTKLRLLSLLTNVGASVYMFSQSDAGSFSRALDGVAIAAALAPVIFGYHWQDVANAQDEYKKRIYGPIAGVSLLRDPVSGKSTPGMAVSFLF